MIVGKNQTGEAFEVRTGFDDGGKVVDDDQSFLWRGVRVDLLYIRDVQLADETRQCGAFA